MRNFLHFPAIHKEEKKTKPKPKHLCGHWRLLWAKQSGSGSVILHRAQNWCCQRLCNRSDASRGLLRYSLLDTCSILSFLFPQGMHVAHICHLLVFLRAPGRLCPLCIKAQLHFLWWLSLCSACSWNGSLHLRWLFARRDGHPAPCSDLLLVLLLDYSKGFGGKYGVQKDRMDKVSCQAMTSACAEQPG